ncbi:MAG TPA: O-acetylhomoserine aminocarboxypropyltransferase/cysteine synthase family protein [Streptosporangiaceae bacterium]|nr:O-acetylhomoserine aminocarboxypropyltransferase/cysteine synthase family protein [Streptosporangiaceae bacterium]
MRFDTLQIHAASEPDGPLGARQLPIYPGNAFLFGTLGRASDLFSLDEAGPIYTRIGNPSMTALEGRLTALEGGAAAVAFASGQAAETAALLNVVRSGDHIVSSPVIYGGTYNLIKNTLGDLGIAVTFVEQPEDPGAWAAAIRPNTRILFTESIGNPNNSVYDYRVIADVAAAHQVLFCVDNTAATPYLFRPFEHGADIVIHSASKFLGGHGVAIGGLVIDGGTFDYAASERYPMMTQTDPSYRLSFADKFGKLAFAQRLRCNILRDTGAAMSPFTAWIIAQGIETLSLRMSRHVSNALAIAQWLEEHPDVGAVNYCGLESNRYYDLAMRYLPRGQGAVFCFDINGGYEQAVRFVEALRLFSHAANIGDLRSLVLHPASTTHSQMSDDERTLAGLSPGSVRLSVGLEDVNDLIEDLDDGLSRSHRS